MRPAATKFSVIASVVLVEHPPPIDTPTYAEATEQLRQTTQLLLEPNEGTADLLCGARADTLVIESCDISGDTYVLLVKVEETSVSSEEVKRIIDRIRFNCSKTSYHRLSVGDVKELS